jgi:hypothetical protein
MINVSREPHGKIAQGFYKFRVVSDGAGGTEYISLFGLFRPTTRAGLVMQGGGPGTIAYQLTLVDEELACNPDPDVQSQVLWSPSIPLSCGPIVRDSNFLLATAMKLTIVGAAELYVAVL